RRTMITDFGRQKACGASIFQRQTRGCICILLGAFTSCATKSRSEELAPPQKCRSGIIIFTACLTTCGDRCAKVYSSTRLGQFILSGKRLKSITESVLKLKGSRRDRYDYLAVGRCYSSLVGDSLFFSQ